MSDTAISRIRRASMRATRCAAKPIFGADEHRPALLHAALAVATIAKGRIISLDTKAAAVPCGAFGWCSRMRSWAP